MCKSLQCVARLHLAAVVQRPCAAEKRDRVSNALYAAERPQSHPILVFGSFSFRSSLLLSKLEETFCATFADVLFIDRAVLSEGKRTLLLCLKRAQRLLLRASNPYLAKGCAGSRQCIKAESLNRVSLTTAAQFSRSWLCDDSVHYRAFNLISLSSSPRNLLLPWTRTGLRTLAKPRNWRHCWQRLTQLLPPRVLLLSRLWTTVPRRI